MSPEFPRIPEFPTGRFTRRDTRRGNIYKPTSLNRYIYCLNNPVRWNDPKGLCEEDVDKEIEEMEEELEEINQEMEELEQLQSDIIDAIITLVDNVITIYTTLTGAEAPTYINPSYGGGGQNNGSGEGGYI